MQVEALTLRRRAVAVAISTIAAEKLRTALGTAWAAEMDIEFPVLAAELTTMYLAPMRLTLSYTSATDAKGENAMFIQSTVLAYGMQLVTRPRQMTLIFTQT